ncbi:aminotransferase class I/II-fold pyridoxal phosphate-dependent enzyme [Pelagibacteraceae bacterium]|jgi:aspartate aminotransferase|nr:aminotransferase class I/II-fold pyridoxal phosphate-dependent enzyme [Pelagibacteraceae bacterium]
MNKKYIKKNIINLEPSATLAINEKSKKLISKGKKIYRFGFGQSPFPVPEKIVATLKENADKKTYLPMQGLPNLREAISRYLSKKTGTSFLKENIIITPGSKEGMFLMHMAFNGDIILPAPSWVSYSPQAQIASNKVHWIQTSADNNWFPTAVELEKKIKSIKNKKIILILNSPNNPSGTTCYNLKELSKIAKKYKIIILSDEIYTDLKFDKKYESISKYYPEGTCITGGLSKWCGAGGWRLGFFAAPKQLNILMDNLKVLASETFSTVNSPVQYAAVEAYNGDYDAFKLKTTNILQGVGMYVYEKLRSNKVLINPPQGGFYLMPEFINKKYKTSSDLCVAVLKETGVALLPGSAFGFRSNKMLVRLSFTDFDGSNFLRNTSSNKKISKSEVEKYAPDVVAGANILSNWAKKL